jgi:hypothetical protein
MSELTHYIVIAPFTFGRNSREDLAFTNCLSHLSSYATGEVPFHCFHVSENTYVNDMGGLQFSKDDPSPVKVWERKVHRRLIDQYRDAIDLVQHGDDQYEVITTYFDEEGNPEN